uniref:Uncharacterized protein LOC111106028 n=1 Tax=Crassostrea virginica TaxID=6565 RepID=A0A8B8B0X2_CRAVI|nr:uncharacterized protein LOC111106028 [Crassostrea virginica]
MDALVRNKLISNHVRDMLNGPSLDNEAKVQGVLFNIKKNMSEDKFNRFLSVVRTRASDTSQRQYGGVTPKGPAYMSRNKRSCLPDRKQHANKTPRQGAPEAVSNLRQSPERTEKQTHSTYLLRGVPPRRKLDSNRGRGSRNRQALGDISRTYHYIGKFRNKLGLDDGIELPTMSREIEKLVDRCKKLETKVNNMSKNMLHSEHGNEGSSTSESSFSSAIQRPRLSGNMRTSSPFTSDLNRAFGHGPEGLGLPKRTHGKVFRDKHSELRNMEDDNEYLLSVHPKISPISPRRNGIRTNTTKTSVIMQSHLDIYERLLLHPVTKPTPKQTCRVFRHLLTTLLQNCSIQIKSRITIKKN